MQTGTWKEPLSLDSQPPTYLPPATCLLPACHLPRPAGRPSSLALKVPWQVPKFRTSCVVHVGVWSVFCQLPNSPCCSICSSHDKTPRRQLGHSVRSLASFHTPKSRTQSAAFLLGPNPPAATCSRVTGTYLLPRYPVPTYLLPTTPTCRRRNTAGNTILKRPAFEAHLVRDHLGICSPYPFSSFLTLPHLFHLISSLPRPLTIRCLDSVGCHCCSGASIIFGNV